MKRIGIFAVLFLTGTAVFLPFRAAAGESAEKSVTILGIGDPAPAFKPGKWIQGEPVAGLDRGKACIVEFWATWCSPCRDSIPHLNKIARKFKAEDLVVIGQNVFEQDNSKVPLFVKKMGTNMTYRVALDDQGVMARTWLEAAGQTGIPFVFLISKDGRIAWMGHPMDLVEQQEENWLINRVVDGTFDVAEAAAKYKSQKQKGENIRKCFNQVEEQMRARKWDEAATTISEIKRCYNPEDAGLDTSILSFGLLLLQGKSDAAAEQAGKECDVKENASELIYSRLLLAQTNLTAHSLDIAYNLAVKANQIAEGKSPLALQNLARATFLKGMAEKAVVLQKSALACADDKNLKKEIKAGLDSYKRGKLPAEKFLSFDEYLSEKNKTVRNALLRERKKYITKITDKKEDAYRPVIEKLNKAIEEKKWADAEALHYTLIKIIPEKDVEFDRNLMHIVINKRDFKAAVALARRVGETEKRTNYLIGVANEMLRLEEPVPEEIVTFACELAAKADQGEIEYGYRVLYLTVLARVAYLKGQRDKAMEFLQKAAGLYTSDENKEVIHSMIESFKTGKYPSLM